jgi:hypothetical protein
VAPCSLQRSSPIQLNNGGSSSSHQLKSGVASVPSYSKRCCAERPSVRPVFSCKHEGTGHTGAGKLSTVSIRFSFQGLKVSSSTGCPTHQESVRAAEQMVTAFGMNNLHTAPALHSLHNDGQAIDMDIAWTGTVEIKDANGTVIQVTAAPRTGMNPQLRQIGAKLRCYQVFWRCEGQTTLVIQRPVIL